MQNKGSILTKEEYENGWHFCPNFDMLLIYKDWPEYRDCNCLYSTTIFPKKEVSKK